MPDTLERRIRTECRRLGVLREVVEKDYAIGHVLAGLSTEPSLQSQLVFKGGTALRKAYFRDYRFSEDLDFTASAGSSDFEGGLVEAVAVAEGTLREQGDFSVSVTRYPVRDTHPQGQEAFRIHVRFPWQGQPLCSLKIEITTDEPIIAEPERRTLLHGYGEELPCEIRCYALEEIVAEKLRALLQTRARLALRGWARPRSRDYFDLWQLLCVRHGMVDGSVSARMLPEKCRVRDVGFSGVDDFFDEAVVERARIDWQQDLRRMVVGLPDFDRCLADVRRQVEALLAA